MKMWNKLRKKENHWRMQASKKMTIFLQLNATKQQFQIVLHMKTRQLEKTGTKRQGHFFFLMKLFLCSTKHEHILLFFLSFFF